MSFFSKIQSKLHLIALFYCTYLYGTSGSTPNSSNENKRKRPTTTPLVPIACRVCDRVFPDNASLVLHFVDAHDIKEIPALNQRRRTLASLIESRLSLNFPQVSCFTMDRISGACHVMLPRTSNYFRPGALPVCFMNPLYVVRTNVRHIQIPVFNSIPPLNGRSYARGLATVSSSLSETNEGQGSFLGNTRSLITQLVKPVQEITSISDEEEDGIDLTLRL